MFPLSRVLCRSAASALLLKCFGRVVCFFAAHQASCEVYKGEKMDTNEISATYGMEISTGGKISRKCGKPPMVEKSKNKTGQMEDANFYLSSM